MVSRYLVYPVKLQNLAFAKINQFLCKIVGMLNMMFGLFDIMSEKNAIYKVMSLS